MFDQMSKVLSATDIVCTPELFASAPSSGRVGRPARQVGLAHNAEVCSQYTSVLKKMYCTCTLSSVLVLRSVKLM
jgi:hypothetical protein